MTRLTYCLSRCLKVLYGYILFLFLFISTFVSPSLRQEAVRRRGKGLSADDMPGAIIHPSDNSQPEVRHNVGPTMGCEWLCRLSGEVLDEPGRRTTSTELHFKKAPAPCGFADCTSDGMGLHATAGAICCAVTSFWYLLSYLLGGPFLRGRPLSKRLLI